MPEQQIKLEAIYDKNINFLIGAGASYGLLPTLALKMKNESQFHTIETLATEIEKSKNNNKSRLNALLFMHYFLTCILPASKLDLAVLSPESKKVIDNYEALLKTILSILNKRKTDKRCNLFTTNYDGCTVLTADKILSEEHIDYVINDGTRGFKTKYLHAKNFNSFIRQTGIFSLHHKDIPQINLIHLHGSVYWTKKNEKIVVDYNNSKLNCLLDETFVKPFSSLLETETTQFSDLEAYADSLNSEFDELAEKFQEKYNSLPIVNPTKWKFHETVFEEHYYQMLRAMSYELEKPNTVFITFGFSFADEHILNLVKRSLSNPSLQLFVCCFDSTEVTLMENKFSGYENVIFISKDDGNLNFEKFNNEIFTLKVSTNNNGGEPQ